MDGVFLLALLTLLSNIFLGYLVLLFLIKLVFNKPGLWNGAIKVLQTNALILAFIVALVAMLGSLYFSEIRGFEPCKLCWFQRIFMYPLPFILGTALFRNKKGVFSYVLPLSVIGLAIAAYHYNLQLRPEIAAPCSTVGFAVSCSQRFSTNFGYITIPFMALSAFLLITLFMFLERAKVIRD